MMAHFRTASGLFLVACLAVACGGDGSPGGKKASAGEAGESEGGGAGEPVFAEDGGATAGRGGASAEGSHGGETHETGGRATGGSGGLSVAGSTQGGSTGGTVAVGGTHTGTGGAAAGAPGIGGTAGGSGGRGGSGGTAGMGTAGALDPTECTMIGDEGTPCAGEERTCGTCPADPCSFCNLMRCSNGTWSRVEAFPDPTCTTVGGAAGAAGAAGSVSDGGTNHGGGGSGGIVDSQGGSGGIHTCLGADPKDFQGYAGGACDSLYPQCAYDSSVAGETCQWLMYDGRASVFEAVRTCMQNTKELCSDQEEANVSACLTDATNQVCPANDVTTLCAEVVESCASVGTYGCINAVSILKDDRQQEALNCYLSEPRLPATCREDFLTCTGMPHTFADASRND